MRGWLKRLRGILGLGVVGGVVGALVGGLWWFGTSLLGSDFTLGTLGTAAALWGGFGAFAAGGHASSVLESGRWRASKPMLKNICGFPAL
jgi:hypothetical protein